MTEKSTQLRLAGRLRALAERLEGREKPPPHLAERIASALERWEKELAHPGPAATESGKKGEIASEAGEFRIWSDGSCSPNPGRGGWAAILEWGGERRELSGGSAQSTNNIMEMTAAIEALRLTPPGARVTLTTDSQYVKNGITRWIRTWKRNGWRTAAGDAVKNRELWGELESLVGARQVAWEWVRGHTGHPENERVDFLANTARAEV